MKTLRRTEKQKERINKKQNRVWIGNFIFNPLKETFDLEVFDVGVKKAAEYKADDLKTHFIYAGWYYHVHIEEIKSMILEKMKKCKIKEAMVTMIYMRRRHLITKEKMVDYSKGKFKTKEGYYKESVNDDLDSFLQKLRNGQMEEEDVMTYYLPMLTKTELKLVEQKNQEHLESYARHYFGRNPDIVKEEMDKSESKSKFVRGTCWRETFMLKVKEVEKTRKQQKKKCEIC